MENKDYEKLRNKILEADMDSCRMVLHVDLLQDYCTAMKSSSDGWQPEENSLSGQLEQLARSGAIHPQDQTAFIAFTRLEHMRSAFRQAGGRPSLLYRRRAADGWRWNLMELVLDRDGRSAVLFVKDVHDALTAVQVREGRDTPEQQLYAQRAMEMAAILHSRFKTMNTVDVESGRCQFMDLTQPASAESIGDYGLFVQNAISSHVHPDDVGTFWKTLSLEHLRNTARGLDEDYKEEVCLYRRPDEGPVRWMEQRVIYSRQGERVAVHILGQDITREKCQEEARVRELEDRANIISSLSTLFFSTYYMDLEHDTFRPVTQLRHVGDLLGEVVQCSAALQIYANHFIHPEDRAEYLRVMNMQNLRQKLRWWQPYVAVEYRKLWEGEEPDSWEWVRATAVLALSDADDMPKTAVYVAQNMTDSQHKNGEAK